MSGGAFNYVCHKSASDFISDDSSSGPIRDLESLQKELARRGFEEEASETLQILHKIEFAQTIIRNIKEELDQNISDIHYIWRGIEWECSGDGSDVIGELYKKYANKPKRGEL